VEILYTILHMIGCDADREEQAELVNHLKVAFHMEPEKHKQLLDIAMMREVRHKLVRFNPCHNGRNYTFLLYASSSVIKVFKWAIPGLFLFIFVLFKQFNRIITVDFTLGILTVIVG